MAAAESSHSRGTERVAELSSIAYDEYLVAQDETSAPEPAFSVDIDDGPRHGPALIRALPIRDANGEVVTWGFGCYFAIWDENENLWDFTYEARLLNTTNTEVAYHTSWASQKPAFSSQLTTSLNDPVEGTYTCKIKWWVDSTYLGEGVATVNLSYTTPSGETTAHDGWNGPYALFRQTMIGSYVGRVVEEFDPGGGGPDTCYDSSLIYPEWTAITGGDWTVGSDNKWGHDNVGWGDTLTQYYRANGRAPCQTQFYQDMKINRPGNSQATYATHLLKAGMTSNTVWAERAGVYASRTW